MFYWKVGILLLCILFLAPALASSKTWIVDDDGGPGVQFTDIQPAIDASAPGDIIVVRNGNYNDFTLSRSLTLTAETGHRPEVNGDCTVTGIRTLTVISGLDTVRLFITQSTGPVLVDDCACIDSTPNSDLDPMVTIESCALVMLSRCHVEDLNPGFYKNAGMRVTGSTVILSECVILGQDGYDGVMADEAYDGGSGMIADYSTLYIQATSCEGGVGGDYGGDDYFSGDGGHGILISHSTLHLFGLPSHVIAGGKGGICNTWPYFGDPGDGIRGSESTIAYSGIDLSDINNVNQTCQVIEVQPAVPVITLAGTGHLGDSIETVLHGLQGSTYTLFASPLPGAYPLGGMYTHLLFSPQNFIFLAGGTLPASHHFPVPSQAREYRGVPVIFQAYVNTPAGVYFMSTSAAFVVR